MIPESQLSILETYKTKTAEEVEAAYTNWLKGHPRKGRLAYSDDMSLDSTDFFNAWRETNRAKEKGWNTDTFFSNYIDGGTIFHPQGKYVAKYAKDTIISKWKGFNNESVNDYVDKIVNSNTGKIDMFSLKSDYIQDFYNKLAKAKKSSEKERLQAIVDAINEDRKMVSDLSKEINDYWDSWDVYLNMWNKDIDEYDKMWKKIIEDLKAPVDASVADTSTQVDDASTAKQVEDTSAANAIENPADNAYQSVSSSTGQDASVNLNVSRTRIYEYISPTIKLDEMSIPIVDKDDSNGTIDPSTGQHVDASGNTINGSPYLTEGNKSPNKSLTIGFSYPLIRINDHYYTETDIKYFSLKTTGFIPTMELYLECSYNDITKINQIKDGDRCSVFINPGHGTIKSYRGDFQITHVKLPKIDQFKVHGIIKAKIYGELFIPSIYDATQTFSFSGSSRDALIDVAQKLGLGFFFSDPENTNDTQMWYSLSDGSQKNNLYCDSPAMEYIKNTAMHAYKNFESFFDCWIDPRYAISFINVAQVLGGAGLDEPIDLALYNKAMIAGLHQDGENREETSENKAKKPKPQIKLLTNIGEEDDALTAFLVTGYAEKNNGAITNQLGLSNANYYSIKNPGLTKATTVEENSIEMKYSIPVNKDKLKHGFYIMAGPGQNLTYTQGENGSYVDQHKTVQGGSIAETQSDTDAEDIKETGNNMLASGNTNKFYECAEGHNLLCNKWLQKKMIEVTLNGCNMQLMRGERIPMLLRDNFSPAASYAVAKNEDQLIHQKIMVSASGWFYIKDLKWIYDTYQKPKHGTMWRTELTLTRREWPIPNFVKGAGAEEEAEKNMDSSTNNTAAKNETGIVITNDPLTGTVKNAIQDTMGAVTTQLGNMSDIFGGTNLLTDMLGNFLDKGMTTEGLQPYMTQIFEDITNACALGGTEIKLVSARRWPVDESGNVVDQPTVQDGTLWKYKNAKGDIVWYSSKTSPHNTGDAIDIINNEGSTYNAVVQYILSDQKTLFDMITNGVYLGEEVSKDDTGNTVKHYHIGKPDKSNSDTLTAQKNWWTQIVAKYIDVIKYGNQEITPAQYLTYSNK